MPGFTAEKSLGRGMGTYRGSVISGGSRGVTSSAIAASPGSTQAIPPALRRDKQCTTEYWGYVTFPMTVCRPRFPRPGTDLGIFEPGGEAAASRVISQQAQFSSLPAIRAFSFCRTVHGPWLAFVAQSESCDFRVPDEFTLAIVGAPQPVELKWKGKLGDAPSIVGAIGNLSPTVPTCTCCGGKKECPDGTCIPILSSCDPTTPA